MTAVDDTVPEPAVPDGTGPAVTLPGPASRTPTARYRGMRRRSRPVLGPLLMITAAAELAATVRLALPGWPAGNAVLAGVLQLVIAAGLAGCGLATWLFPVHRSVFSTAAVLLGIAALIPAGRTAFAAGTVLAAAGGALGFAWVPGRPR